MAKLFKNKDKLVMYIPFEVISGMNLKEGDDVDFFRYNQNSFIFAKKSDITDMILGKKPSEAQVTSTSPQIERFPAEELSAEEILVLKKLDTLKYGMRSKENVVKMLDKEERIILKGLMKKKAVSLFAKDKSKEALFSISKRVYDKYLMRKKMGEQVQSPAKTATQEPRMSYQKPQAQAPSQPAYGLENENVKTLEKDGFIVLQYEAEASALSLALEQSIRRGMVLGTRSFNKKFYIIMRSYFDRHGSKILKALKDGELKVAQIAKEVGIDEDGARAILYLLAESGDVSEKKKDLFTLA